MVQKTVGKQRDETHHAKANLKTDMVGWLVGDIVILLIW